MEIHVSRRRALVTSITGIAGMSVAKVNAGPQLVSRRSDWDTSAFDLLLKKPAHVKQAYDITAIGVVSS